jgi:tetratricopeptide (TPR) repeat protein
MSPSRFVRSALLALLLLGAHGAARADDATELERAKTSYDAGRYAEGVERFRQMLSPDSPQSLRDPAAIERARAYYAACLIALGRTEDADAQIERIIRNNPLYSADPVVFPGKVVDRFIDVKARLKNEIEGAFRARADAERRARGKVEQEQRNYIEGLQRLAAQETVVVRRSRWIALVPLGAGQFQNGDQALGYAFLASEALLAVTSATAFVIHTELVADYPRHSPGTVDFEAFQSSKAAALRVNHYATAALAAVALTGIIHAELTFVPEVREVRTRPIPKAPPLVPAIGAIPSGLSVGLSGSF